MRYQLTYHDESRGEMVTSIYNEEDLREWLDNWPHWTGPDKIYVERVA